MRRQMCPARDKEGDVPGHGQGCGTLLITRKRATSTDTDLKRGVDYANHKKED